MKIYLLILCLFVSFSCFSQNTINNYKYVLVPAKYSFLKENDQYDLNSFTKTFLQDKGFTVYFDNTDLPGELANNKCRALTADVLEKSGMFSTSLTFLLKDCHGNIIFKSKEGKSREKDYKTGYTMALKDAFASLEQTPYTYNGSINDQAAAVVTTVTPVSTTVLEKQVAATTTSVETATAPISAKTAEVVTSQPAGTLYAQAIANGYQLIDTTPKIVLTLMKTSAEGYFIASSAAANGIVLKKGGDWFFEYYKGGNLVSEKLLVKF